MWKPPTPDEIRTVRGERSQAEMAELAGLGSQPRWAEYENGRRVPSQERWTLVLLKCNLHPDWKLVRRARVVQSA